jgi:hypothetical protein
MGTDGRYSLDLMVGTPPWPLTVSLDGDIGDFPARQDTAPCPVPGLEALWAYKFLVFNEPSHGMPEALIRRRVLVAYGKHSA